MPLALERYEEIRYPGHGPKSKNCVLLNSKGELLFRYPDMSNPRATISDSSGNIFLVGLNKDTETK